MINVFFLLSLKGEHYTKVHEHSQFHVRLWILNMSLCSFFILKWKIAPFVELMLNFVKIWFYFGNFTHLFSCSFISFSFMVFPSIESLNQCPLCLPPFNWTFVPSLHLPCTPSNHAHCASSSFIVFVAYGGFVLTCGQWPSLARTHHWWTFTYASLVYWPLIDIDFCTPMSQWVVAPLLWPFPSPCVVASQFILVNLLSFTCASMFFSAFDLYVACQLFFGKPYIPRTFFSSACSRMKRDVSSSPLVKHEHVGRHCPCYMQRFGGGWFSIMGSEFDDIMARLGQVCKEVVSASTDHIKEMRVFLRLATCEGGHMRSSTCKG